MIKTEKTTEGRMDDGTRAMLRKVAGDNPNEERLAKWISRTIRCGIRAARKMAAEALKD